MADLKNKFKIITFSLYIVILINCNVVTADTTNTSTQETSFTDVSIVIASCDKYASLWDPFFSLLFKQWPSLLDEKLSKNKLMAHKIPIFFISNSKTYNKYPNRIQASLFPNEISWSDNMKETLSKINTKYILYLQEDYFFNLPVKEELLLDILNYVKSNNAIFTQLFCFNATTEKIHNFNNNLNLAELDKYSLFKVNLQAGIWNKQALQWLIKSKENLVEFEDLGSKRSQGMPGLFLVYTATDTYPISYINAVHLGYLLQDAINYLHEQGIEFAPKSQSLPIDKDNKLRITLREWKHNFLVYLIKIKNYIKFTFLI